MEQYAKAGLKEPYQNQTENEFEKRIFCAINLCRFDPKRYAPIVREVYKKNQENELLKDAKNMDSLIKKLTAKLAEPLGQLVIDDLASKACKQNNQEKIDLNQDIPTKGGNIFKYNQLVGQDKFSSCDEYTMVKFEGDDAMEFVGL